MRRLTLIVFAVAVGAASWVFAGCSSSSTTTTTGDAGADGVDAAGAGACSPACTGANVVCDPADNKCKPDGTTTAVGAKCTMSGADPVCGTHPKATCNDLPADGFPGGYCSFEPCTTAELCPVGATCAHLGGESPACWKNCTSAADCRAPDYECLAASPLITSGPSMKVCYLTVFACKTKADCPTSKPTCVFPDGGAVLGTCT